MERLIKPFFEDIYPLLTEIDGVVYAPAVDLVVAVAEASAFLIILGIVLYFLVVEPIALLAQLLSSFVRKRLAARKQPE